MLPKIQIRTFGTLQVIREQQAVTESDWHTRQARQLLKILITERPRPVSTDRLIEILWPSSMPAAAATTLRSAINALRNVLEPERPNRAPSRYILTQSPGYAFHLHADIWLDVEAFEMELAHAHQTADLRTRQRHLEAATALYKDDYLISDPYADWVQNERERLRERYFTALLELAEMQAAAANYAEAISNCRRILARDEVRENAYQLLMRFQAESGDSASALLTYERCRTILAEELGADPSPLTQVLHQRILNGEIVPDTSDKPRMVLGVEAQAPAAAGGFVYQAGELLARLPQSFLLPMIDPTFLEAFVGREQETALLKSRLDSAMQGAGQLVILEGESGIGKTRLAYAALRSAIDAGATVISVTCQPLERKFPFAPLADSIGRYLHDLPDSAIFSLPHASLAQMAQVIPSLQDRMPGLALPSLETTSSAEENRQRLIEGIVAFVVELARLRPLVLFLDDLHWADQDTLAVVSRLAHRMADLSMLIVLAYRTDDLVENEALITLLHSFNRAHRHTSLMVRRLTMTQVQEIIDIFTGQPGRDSAELAMFLYEATQGNPLFVTEALRDLQERYQAGLYTELGDLTDMWSSKYRQVLTLRRSQRVQEIVLERIQRLPENALAVLQLAAVIGRHFSLELLEAVAPGDPLDALEVLLQRKFFIERPDERLDFSHQTVRQAVYDSLNMLQRRRLHRQVGDALVALGQADRNAGETAFHYGQAGRSAQSLFGRYSVLAGEKLLQSYGFRQAIEHFDNALTALSAGDNALTALSAGAQRDPDLELRALQGRGLAFEALMDPDGVTDTYRRLQTLARARNDVPLMRTAHSRLAAMLELVGQQRESNELLRELMDTLARDPASHHSAVVADLLERRRHIYGPDEQGELSEWSAFVAPPPVPAEPVQDVQRVFDPVHAVLPLMDYGWTLRVQGQFKEATDCLHAALALALQTQQRAIASIASFQLAVIARMQGRLEASQELNEQSMALNHQAQDSTTELVSLWPRIASAFQSLHAGRLDEAERRLQRVLDFLDNSNSFRNHRNSATIGLGLVALGYDDLARAQRLIEEALSDAVNLYPYVHVQGLLGLAEIAHRRDEPQLCRSLLYKALRFAGQRSLIEEYIETVLAVARLSPAQAPVELLLEQALVQARAVGLQPFADQLTDALESLASDSQEQLQSRICAD